MIALLLMSITATMLYPKYFIVPITLLLQDPSEDHSQLQTLALSFALAECFRYYSILFVGNTSHGGHFAAWFVSVHIEVSAAASVYQRVQWSIVCSQSNLGCSNAFACSYTWCMMS
jgi:hypothetical protein